MHSNDIVLFGSPVIPLQAAMLLFCAAAVLIQRPNPWPKLWTSLLAPILVWGCAGWTSLLEIGWASIFALFSPSWQSSPNHPTLNRVYAFLRADRALFLSILVCLFALAWSARQTALTYPGFYVPPGAPEQAAGFIQSRYQTGDLLAASSADGAAILYYMTHLGVDYPHPRELRRLAFQRVFVVVDSKENQSIESVVKDREEDLGKYRLGEMVEQWQGESIAVYLQELGMEP